MTDTLLTLTREPADASQKQKLRECSKDGACYPWRGEKTDAGYFRAWFHRRRTTAHRLAYEFVVGPRLGVVLDALQGTIYVSDAQITHLEATRHDGGAGSLVVEIRALGEPQMALQSLATP